MHTDNGILRKIICDPPSQQFFNFRSLLWGGAPSCLYVVEARLLEFWIDHILQHILITCCSFGTGFWSLRIISSNKNGPIKNIDVKPIHAVTCGECLGVCWIWWRFSEDQIRQFWMFTVPHIEKWASSVHRMFHCQFSSTSIRTNNVKANVSRRTLSPDFNSWKRWICYR